VFPLHVDPPPIDPEAVIKSEIEGRVTVLKEWLSPDTRAEVLVGCKYLLSPVGQKDLESPRLTTRKTVWFPYKLSEIQTVPTYVVEIFEIVSDATYISDNGYLWLKQDTRTGFDSFYDF
jgi:hypothetical protein